MSAAYSADTSAIASADSCLSLSAVKRSPSAFAKASDIDYYYASRLPGEPAAGVNGIHTHPVAPRTARISLRVDF